MWVAEPKYFSLQNLFDVIFSLLGTGAALESCSTYNPLGIDDDDDDDEAGVLLCLVFVDRLCLFWFRTVNHHRTYLRVWSGNVHKFTVKYNLVLKLRSPLQRISCVRSPVDPKFRVQWILQQIKEVLGCIRLKKSNALQPSPQNLMTFLHSEHWWPVPVTKRQVVAENPFLETHLLCHLGKHVFKWRNGRLKMCGCDCGKMWSYNFCCSSSWWMNRNKLRYW